MNPEDIIINLKVIEKVQINEKLISRGQYLNIEYVSIVPLSIRRWWRQDNRNEMLKKLHIVIHSAIKLIPEHNERNTQFLIKEKKNSSGLDIKRYLSNCIQGLNNLKETYSDCSSTCAQLDVLIDTITNSVSL